MTIPLGNIQDALGARYRIERELGRGGMATVFLALDPRHDRRVAIKVLNPDLSASLGAERFLREIRITSRLAHPNILPIHDSGEADGVLFYVMPFVDGESLRARITRERQLPVDAAVRLTCEIASALTHAHAMGVVHRDIKPENILIESGHAVVADFGIARALTTAATADSITGTGVALGTPAYMSPEQAAGEHDLDGRSDLYSLACVTYEMLVGQPPFTAPTIQALVARHLTDPVPPVTTVRPAVPDEVEDAILTALEKAPADRFHTVEEFAAALEPWMTASWTQPRARTGTGRVTARATARRTARARRPSVAPWRAHLRAIAVTAVAAVAVAGGAGRWVWRSSHLALPGDAASPDHLAVLYFDAGDSLRDLADGLTESLIGRLSQVEALDVVSRNGVSPFRGRDVDRDSVARALGVGTLVTGSVEPEGTRLRVSVQLIDARSGAPYERASFTEPRERLLVMRDTLATEVARVLRRYLGEEIHLRELQAGTRNPEAWRLVLRAERLRKDADAARRADRVPAAALDLARADSTLVLASLADARWAEPVAMRAMLAYERARLERDPLRARPFLDATEARADDALVLDPRSAAALEARGTARYARVRLRLVPDERSIARLTSEADGDLRAAVGIDPTRASAWNTLSLLQYGLQNPSESHLFAYTALQKDAWLAAAPDLLYRLWVTSYDMEQLVDADRWCATGARRFPGDPRFDSCQLWMMTTEARAPDVPRAWSLWAAMRRLTPRTQWDFDGRLAEIAVAGVIGRAGLRDSASRVLLRARPGAGVDPEEELVGYEAFARSLNGQRDSAITLLERYFTNHPEHRTAFRKAHSWWWRGLQDDPRFRIVVGGS